MSRIKRLLEFKLKVVQHFLSTIDGQRKTGARFGIDQSHVRQWVNLYKLHGIKGFSATQRSYSAEEKESILLYMREHRLSARQTAAQFNIQAAHTISQWDRRYDEGGLEALRRKARSCQKMPKSSAAKNFNFSSGRTAT